MKWILLILASFLSLLVFSQTTITEYPTDDIHIRSGQDTNGQTLKVLWTSDQPGQNLQFRTYIKFDLSNISEDDEITFVEFRLQDEFPRMLDEYNSLFIFKSDDTSWTEASPPTSSSLPSPDILISVLTGAANRVDGNSVYWTFENDLVEEARMSTSKILSLVIQWGGFDPSHDRTFGSSEQMNDLNKPQLIINTITPSTTTITGRVELYDTEDEEGGTLECDPDNIPLVNMKDVTVTVENLTSMASEMDDTGVDGIYGVDIADQGNVFSATPNFDYLSIDPTWTWGEWIDRTTVVSGFDQTAIRLHVNFLAGDITGKPILCPFKRIAADVDGNGIIDEADIDIVGDFVITQPVTVPAWRFIPQFYLQGGIGQKDIQFVGDFWNNNLLDNNEETYPFQIIYHYSDNDGSNQESYDYSSNSMPLWMDKLNRMELNLPCNTTNWDFYAIKIGNVVKEKSMSPTENNSTISLDNSTTNNQNFLNQKEYSVSVKANTTDTLLGTFQLGLYVSTNLMDFIAIESVNSSMLGYDTQQDFGLTQLTDKLEIRTIFTSNNLKDIVSPSAGEVTLFSFKVKAKQDFSGGIEFKNEVLEALFVSEELETMSGTLSFEITEL